MSIQKWIVILFCIFFIAEVTAQKLRLEGLFCNPEYLSDANQCFTFKGNNTFEYISGKDLPPNIFGKGSYKVINNRLILYYQPFEPYVLSYHKAAKTLSKSDSIIYRFKVSNLEGEAIPGTNVLFYNCSSLKYDGIILNENGEGELKFAKSNDTINFQFSYVGYNFHSLQINRKYNHSIEVFLPKDGQQLPIEKHIDTLKILSANEDFLKFQNFDGLVTKFYRRN